MSYEVYAGILKMLDEFQDGDLDIRIVYRKSAELSRLDEKYGITDIAKGDGDFAKAVALLEWISSHVRHKGNYDNHIARNAEALLDYAYDKGDECGINCVSLSIALTECLLLVGLRARSLYLMPFSPYDGDNHVVCEVWISEWNKWVMLDPTYSGYVKDSDGQVLSVIELRNTLANRASITFSDGFSYNGNKKIDFEDTKTYYAKDLFYFMCTEAQGYNADQFDAKRITFAPVGYDVRKSMLANIAYRIEKQGDADWLRTWRSKVEGMSIIYKSLDVLYSE